MENDNVTRKPRPGHRGDTAAEVNPDVERAASKPRPGGRPLPVAPTPAENFDPTLVKPRQVAPHTPITLSDPPKFKQSVLVDAASQLLSLTPQLRYLDSQINVPQLHLQAVHCVKRLQQVLAGADLTEKVRTNASYVLCALVDETVLNTPWGEHSTWSQKTLLSVFHHETYGGKRFFDILREALDGPRRDYDFIELLYLCMSLGFMGKYRIDPQGKVHIEQLRADTHAILQAGRDRYNETLSVNIKSASDIKRQLHSYLPVWLLTGILALAAFGLYTHWLLGLNQRTDQLRTELASLVPAPAQPLPQGRVRPVVVQLRELLAPEIARQILRVDDYGTRITIVLQTEEMFTSSQSDIHAAFHPILDKIAKALEAIPGRVTVSGHTDDRDIRTSSFPSNWHLSLARASEVTKYMSSVAALTARLIPEGRGANEPIAGNDTPQGRAQNRRVEIEIFNSST
ncbi:MAG: type VI secretion system protein TssL [Gammaproteobacteria bacterium]|nr:type VI secretion system protein TssL [Gammaproteobacteria bacterium]